MGFEEVFILGFKNITKIVDCARISCFLNPRGNASCAYTITLFFSIKSVLELFRVQISDISHRLIVAAYNFIFPWHFLANYYKAEL